ncbi:HD-GYP domain-containing protein [Thiomicrorhabdus indica]|uniref:HD-GYP domain-containing protein n=1 Tax=Thiomicrorhabdus indica TaxID=2267253 RepID=UPI002AA81D7A|nr:HD domain-containing phosphohydrolase [Thiomicrorhabdus indica]
MDQQSISFADVAFALVSTLDLVGDDDGHGKRVAQMSYQVGKAYGLDEDELNELFLAGLLHDLGVSTTYVHSHLIESMEWEGVHEHCRVGAKLAEESSVLRHLSPYILHHHDRWSQLQRWVAAGRLSERQAILANTILLVDRIDAFAWQELVKKGYKYYHMAKDFCLQQIDLRWREFFSESIYQAFLQASQADIFWMMNDKQEVIDFTHQHLAKLDWMISMSELQEMAKIFANAVDAKSPFTYQHSLGVASLARYLAKQIGLSDSTQQRIYLAGLLHDLGKLDMEDEVLDKQGPLDQQERQKMNRHSFVSLMILRRIKGMEDIALWASQHHEKLNGGGYPTREKDLPLESRILAVADIVQALAQNRPYREGLAMPKILSIVDEMTEQGELDKAVVNCLHANSNQAYQVALSQA